MEYSIGTRIRNKRKQLGLTQEQLAKKVGVTFQAVSKWENDISCPDIQLLDSIAKALEMTVDEIVSGNTKDSSSQSQAVKERPFYGRVTGTVTKDIHADVGQIIGDVQADIYGDVKGNIIGTVKNVYGNIGGSVWGSVNGDVTGYIKGNLCGVVTGSVKKGVHGRVVGQIIGDGINVEPPRGYKGKVGMGGFIAKWYAGITKKRIDIYADMAKLVKANVAEGSSILEVAPGPGYLAIELAKMGDYKISGLDISDSFVKIARENATKAGVKIDFFQGNAAYMPFSNNAFDFIVCTAAFKNFSEPVKSLNEMYRVLRPNGKALIIDLRRDVSTQEINSHVRDMNLSWLNSLLTKWSFKSFLVKSAYSRDEFIGLISNTSFDEYEINDGPRGIEFEIWLQK